MPSPPKEKRVAASVWRAVGRDARGGAMVGATITATLAPIVVGVWLSNAQPFGASTGFGPCFAALMTGLLAFAAFGAATGGLVAAVFSIVRHRPPVRFSLAFLLVLLTAAGMGMALLVWLATPRKTAEDHAYVFLRLCAKDRFDEAESYIQQHPEIATDQRAFGGRPTLYTAAYSYDDPRTAKLLLDHGAQADKTAAWFAARKENLLVFALLVEYGATLGPEHRELERKLLEAAYQENLETP